MTLIRESTVISVGFLVLSRIMIQTDAEMPVKILMMITIRSEMAMTNALRVRSVGFQHL